MLFILFTKVFICGCFVHRPGCGFKLVFVTILFFTLCKLCGGCGGCFTGPAGRSGGALVFVPLTLVLVFALMFNLVCLILVVI